MPLAFFPQTRLQLGVFFNAGSKVRAAPHFFFFSSCLVFRPNEKLTNFRDIVGGAGEGGFPHRITNVHVCLLLLLVFFFRGVCPPVTKKTKKHPQAL